MAGSAELQFFRGFLAKPLAIGSPVPSGRKLATAIAAQIPVGARLVLELGAGTGAVTQAILDSGITPGGLVAVEAEPGFAAMLREQFPRSHILEGNAFAFDELLRAKAMAGAFDAIVSGLPVLDRKPDERAALLRLALAHLRRGAPFVQFSYAFWPPYPKLPGVSVTRAATEWSNVPPMNIWVHRAAV